jgi:hypothetical protein
LPVLLAASAASGGARADEGTERYTLRAELGAEYDSNAHRAETVAGATNVPLVASPLARGVVSGALADAIADGQDIALSATAAGKLFTAADARDEDVAIAQSGAAWRLALGRHATLGASGAYYEAFQRGGQDSTLALERRDFRSLSSGLRLGLGLAPGAELGLGGGYRYFVFKPDRDIDFRGPTAALDLRWARETADQAADWELGLSALYEHRAFAGPALVNTCQPPSSVGTTCPPTVGAALRTDDFLVAGVEVARTGAVLVGAGYTLNYNVSNSFGETVMRHIATARFAAALPLQLFLGANAELLFAHYPNGTVIGVVDVGGRPFASIDDENRSNVRAYLTRNLGERVQLIARYAFYGPALGSTPVSYRRQTALLAVSFTIDK